ncbi:MAG: hypothetical protein ACOCWJ_05345 [Verrucomicrobiota bacterium]
MNALLLPAGHPASLAPLTDTRDAGECPVANHALHHWLRYRCRLAGLQVETARTQIPPAPEPLHAETLFLREDAWICADSLASLRQAGGGHVLRTSQGDVLAWCGHTADPPPANAPAVPAAPTDFRIRYPWQLLEINRELLDALDTTDIHGHCDPRNAIDGILHLGEDSRILPGVYIEGPVVIGRNCTIGPNCYLRGRTAIGDGCHIGQAVEIKNSIVMSNTSIGHLSYCGDSVVGENVNFGAGTITANFRHDGRNHRCMIEGALLDTGRRKLGAVIGDDVHTGIHTSIYPGRKLWPHTSTRPGDIVQKDLHS